MRFVKTFTLPMLFLAAIFVTPSLKAQTAPTAEHIAVAREAVEASGASKSFDTVIPVFIEQTKATLLGSNPDLTKEFNQVGEQILPEFQKRVGELINNIANVYAKSFTIDELKKIRDFYRSPEGKKMVEKLPSVLEQSFVQSQEWSQVMSRDILARFRSEFAKKNIKL